MMTIEPRGDDLSLLCAVEQYIEDCVARGLSASTVRWYRWILMTFGEWCGSMRIGEVDPRVVRRYLAYVRDRSAYPDREERGGKVSRSTVAGIVRAIRAFGGWCEREGLVAGCWCEKLNPPKTKKPLPKCLSASQVERLLKSAASRRNQTMLLFMVDTGVRLSEVCGLRRDDVDIELCVARVDGKTGQRFVAFAEFVGERLVELWNLVDSEWAFCAESGDPLAPQAVRSVFRRWGNRVGVHVSPHRLRHTCAVMFLENGGDALTLQTLLGHSDISTTRVYVGMSMRQIRSVHRRASPAERWHDAQLPLLELGPDR